jgi:alpha-galactosidase
MTDTPAGLPDTSLASGPCYARLDAATGEFVAGNDLVERRWSVDAAGRLHASSLRDKVTGVEWLRAAAESNTPFPSPAATLPDEPRRVTLTRDETRSPVEAESLRAVLTASGAVTSLTYRFQVFPGASGVTMSLATSGAPDNTVGAPAEIQAEDAPTGVELADQAGHAGTSNGPADTLESLALAPLHLRLTQVTLWDRTDSHNELVHETDWLLHTAEAPLHLSGNLFFVEDVLTRAGLIFLKCAPLPHARPVPSPHDLLVRPGDRQFTLVGHGTKPGESASGYFWVTLTYQGGSAGRTAALHAYQRQVRPYQPNRDGQLLSNTWGDRNRDGRINAAFLNEEIEAGARLGVDVVQIDDGWQKGRTANSVQAGGVWEGFYAAEEDFWAVHPERFPDGLVPLIRRARELGMRFGLWFAPDSADDFARWREDADRLLALHREHGVDFFKIDGVKLRTRRGERNLRAFFDRVLQESGGRVVFDNDVTAETRPGYWGLMDAGPLFVENRYTDWRRYWPHATLRNLWRLAHYIDPVRLRMEWLNLARNVEKYADDPLAPAAYRPDYLFATVMFSSPLGWFEVSQLPEAYFAEAAPLIAAWKQHREAIFAGTILPIGDAPDGTSWTGFASVAPDRRSAYVLLFRETNEEKTCTFRLPLLAPDAAPVHVERLIGEGEAELLADRRLLVAIPHARRFMFARVRL